MKVLTEKFEKFIKIPYFLYDYNLQPADILVFSLIYDLHNLKSKNEIFITRQKLGELLSLSRQTISSCIKRLSAAELISDKRNGFTMANSFVLNGAKIPHKTAFVPVPKDIFHTSLRPTEILVYAHLYQRYLLSLKNNLTDEEGNTYCYYTQDKIAKKIGISVRKVGDIISHLKKLGYIAIHRPKPRAANQIYILQPPVIQSDNSTPSIASESGTDLTSYCEKSVVPDVKVSDVKKLPVNYTRNLDPYSNTTPYKTPNIEVYERMVRDNTCADYYKRVWPNQEKTIENLLSICIDTVMSNAEYIRVCGEDKAASIVKSRFMKIDHGAFHYALVSLMQYDKPIKNMINFARTLLYTGTLMSDLQLQNVVLQVGLDYQPVHLADILADAI